MFAEQYSPLLYMSSSEDWLALQYMMPTLYVWFTYKNSWAHQYMYVYNALICTSYFGNVSIQSGCTKSMHLFTLKKEIGVLQPLMCFMVFCVQPSFKVPDKVSCMYLVVAGIEPTPCWSTLRSWSRVFWLEEASFRQDVWRSGHTYSITSLTVVVREPPSLLAAAGMASSKMTPRSVVSCEISQKN